MTGNRRPFARYHGGPVELIEHGPPQPMIHHSRPCALRVIVQAGEILMPQRYHEIVSPKHTPESRVMGVMPLGRAGALANSTPPARLEAPAGLAGEGERRG